MRYVPLLLAGLFRKKTRTILTLLSVTVAFMLFGLLQAVTTAFESGADSADDKRYKPKKRRHVCWTILLGARHHVGPVRVKNVTGIPPVHAEVVPALPPCWPS